jgi:hypothetical protein
MTHAVLSASAASRWLACPGSVRLTRDLPDEGSVYAAEGTLAHELAELCLRRGWNADDLPEYAGGAEGEDWNRYPPAMREHVQYYLDHVRDLPGKPMVEVKVSFDQWVPGGFGTADVILLADGKAHLVDLKYGQGVKVSAAQNPQLMLYALGAHQDHGWLWDVTEWSLTICQPRLDHVDTWSITTADLLAWGETVRPIAERALTDDAPLVPGEKQCRFCKVKATCRARTEAAQRTAYEDFGHLPKGDQLSPDELASALGRLDAMEQWAHDLREHALAEHLAGRPLPGWKLVEGRAVRQWTETAPAALLGAGLTDVQIYERKLIGLTAAEKLLGGKKKAAPVLDGCTTKPAGKPTLAPASDPRPALSATPAAQDFASAA